MPKVLEDIEIGDVSPAELIDYARARGIFVFDLETTGTHVHLDRIEGIAFYVPPFGDMPELKAWFPFVHGTMRTYVQPDESAEEQSARLKYERTHNKGDRLAWEAIQQKPVIAELRDAMDQVAAIEALRPLFENSPNTVCIAHNIKFDVSFMRLASGCERGYFTPYFKLDENVIFADSMLADFLCDENHYAYGLKGRVKTLFDHDMTTYKDVMRNRRQLTLSFVEDEIKADSLGHYAMEDCYWTWRLFEHSMKKLDELTPGTPLIGMEGDIDEKDISPYNRCRTKGLLERIYWGIDMKIALVLEEMESAGILIDWRHLKTVTTTLNKKKEKILDKIEQQIGWTLNPNSAAQVSTLLFANPPTGLALPSKGVKRGKSGQISTGSKEIQHLRRVNPVVTDILDWRSADTIVANFSAKLAGLSIADEHNRIYSHFNQTGTKIFRLSCIAKGTPVEVVRDVSKFPRGIPIEDVQPGDLVYTYDDDLNLTLRPVKKAWKTGEREVVRLHWRKRGYKGKNRYGYLDLTPEHPVRLVDGSYRRADELKPNEAVLAVSRSVDHDGYAALYATRVGKINHEHRFIYESTIGPTAGVVHHKDHNRLNNLPGNLEDKSRGKHAFDHGKEQWSALTEAEKDTEVARLKGLWTPRRKARHSAQMRQGWRDGKFKQAQGDKHPPYEEITVEWLEGAFDKCGSAYKVCKTYGMNHYRLKKVMTALEFVPGNHKIERIERIGVVTDVYDLEIEGTHNFIAGEICVHNSSDPVNLQNQPRDRNLIRRAFCAHLADDHERAHLMLFGCDYSQIELRVAAFLSGDAGMIEVYANEGPCSKGSDGAPCKRYRQWVCDTQLPNGDYCGHLWAPPDASDAATRACPKCGGRVIEHQKRCRHVDLHQRTAEDVAIDRNPLAKNANFGLLYRMAAPKFSQYADLYDDQGNARIDYARELIKKWFEAYPGIEPFQAQVEAKLKGNGWVAETLTGRQRRLARERYKNEYRAVTQGIQFTVSGTAQDILKVAMLRIWEEKQRLIANSPPALRKLWEQFRMIIQVHDELMFEGPLAIRDEIVELMTTRMETAAELRRPGPKGSVIYVPLKTDVKVGRCWDDCH